MSKKFKITATFWSVIKSDDCNILPVRVFNVPPRGFPVEFCYDSGLKKTRMMPLSDRQKKFDGMLNHLETYRRTDGRTDFPQQYRALHDCMLTRDNNVKTARLP